MTKDDEKYIHPLLVKIIRKCQKVYPSTSSDLQKNEHEMSWSNGSNGRTMWSSNEHGNNITNGKQIRVGSSSYENAGFQET